MQSFCIPRQRQEEAAAKKEEERSKRQQRLEDYKKRKMMDEVAQHMQEVGVIHGGKIKKHLSSSRTDLTQVADYFLCYSLSLNNCFAHGIHPTHKKQLGIYS